MAGEAIAKTVGSIFFPGGGFGLIAVVGVAGSIRDGDGGVLEFQGVFGKSSNRVAADGRGRNGDSVGFNGGGIGGESFKINGNVGDGKREGDEGFDI